MPTTTNTNPPKKSKKYLGFTLVELIVVITILVILGTIAFLNLGGFSSSARDSARISNLANLQKGLNLYQVKTGTYPTPESSVAITASGVTIGYQGFAKDIVGGIAKISKGGTVDPSDTSIYTTYAVNQTLTKMQAMVFLEDSTNVTAFNPTFIPTTYAATTTDYSKRFPKTSGDSLGILLSTATGTLNQPVQETGTGVDVVTTNTGYIAVFGNKTTDKVSGTGTILAQVKSTMTTGGSKYPGCDTYDIVVGTQVWAACNVGATVAFMGTQSGANDNPIATTANAGYFFQWGENVAWTYGSGLTSSDNCLWNRDSQSCGASVYGTGWQSSVSDLQSDGLDRWYKWSDTRGPCAAGYHVPTQTEWNTSSTNLVSRNTFAFTLKFPMMGYRFFSSGLLTNQGSYIFYWSSSPSSINGYSISFSSTLLNPMGGANRAWGFPVRCIKN